jgi:hypothetical protein
VIHENGRLTLLGSLFYFDHFLGCAPMAVFFALLLAGGGAYGCACSSLSAARRARRYGFVLLSAAAAFLVAAFLASWQIAGRERTLDYLLQRIERDGVVSRGGNWNQLQLSNLPIGLSILAVARILSPCRGVANRAAAGAIALAAALSATLTLWSWPGLEAFRNPRWLAHSLRELATYPLTGVPAAIAAIVLLESAFTGRSEWKIRLRWPPVVLLALAGAMTLLELAMLGDTDPLALAQRPRFAPEGLSIAYLLASHVFEHVLDFVWLSILSAGLYALLRARRAPAADARLVGSFSGNQGTAARQPGLPRRGSG